MSKKVINFAANFAVESLNRKLQTSKAGNGEKCARVKLESISDAHEQVTSTSINYIVRFTVTPSSTPFEALIRRKMSTLFSLTPKFEMLQEIVQMNQVTENQMCVPESGEGTVKRKKDDDEEEEYEDFGEL